MSLPVNADDSDARPVSPGSLPVETTTVIVWRPERSSRANLEGLLRRWARRGWTVRRCEPRVLEGPAYGALLVLEREALQKRPQRRPIHWTADCEERSSRESAEA